MTTDQPDRARSDQAEPTVDLGSPPAPRPKIVLTGGPGGGKTTAADLFQREIGDAVAVVPEAATILFGGGFPRTDEVVALRAVQRAIFEVQRRLEEAFAARYPERLLLCDRGTVDGAAYWPDTVDSFFASFDTTLEQELARYDGVIFFESAAVGGGETPGNNPVRIETSEQARELDARLRTLWSRHPRFVLVPNSHSFFRKITFGLASIESLAAQFGARLR